MVCAPLRPALQTDHYFDSVDFQFAGGADEPTPRNGQSYAVNLAEHQDERKFELLKEVLFKFEILDSDVALGQLQSKKVSAGV